MSKIKPKSIRWRDANKTKPKLHPARYHSKDHSNRVILWVVGIGKNIAQDCACFGVWVQTYGWSIEGRTGSWEVTHWAYIPNPIKKPKRPLVKCEKCRGTGIVFGKECEICDGKGKF